jgi:lipid-binding SYLF domain-containing protein
MKSRNLFPAALALTIGLLAANTASAQFREERILYNSSAVLDEFMSLRLRAIPRSMLADAEGVVIIPSMVKAGFVIGGRHGKGVLIMRDDAGHWRVPVFVSVTGGNIGYQIGVQATDLVLVFKTRRSIEGILDGKLTLGVDAAAAAGPVGREAAAATDGRLQAEIYSYSRSRGLFAGVSIDGSVLRVADDLNAAYYGGRGDALGDDDPAVQLLGQVAAYSADRRGGFEPQPFAPADVEELPVPAGQRTSERLGAPQAEPGGEPTLAPPRNGDSAELLRSELGQSATAMSRLLDRSWNEYLALPGEIFQAQGRPSPETLRLSLSRFDSVAAEPQYRALNTRAEFRTTHALLKQYEREIADSRAALRLPAPPPTGDASVIVPPQR